jgi:CRISPR-associated protein Csm1
VTGKTLATNIWMGDYHVRDARLVASFESLANASKGVKRIGVLRADIDNLGQAFVSGFIRKQAENPAKYVTISRTATLSRNLSMFFKYYLNDVLANPAKLPIQPFSLDGSEKTAARNVMIIYSGGDDLFLVGAWNEIIECAVDIHHLFALYGQGTLTLSAGVGVFPHSYPLIRMAEESGSLEATAKQLDADKNAIALFGNDQVEHCYHWQQFEKEIVGEKLRFLQKHLGTKQEQEDTSTAFLYQLLTLLRHADKKINLARFAYTLARKAERIVDNVADNTEEQRAAKQAMQREFCDKMYAWYLDETQRKQLMTAIYLYVYLYRE